jgi:hypothetical protein
MNPRPFSASALVRKGDDEAAAPPLKLRSLVWRSALLNLGVVLTAFPVLATAGPGALVPTFVLMVMVSVLIWVFTLAVFSFSSIVRIFRGQGVRRASRGRAATAGLADRWLDGP